MGTYYRITLHGNTLSLNQAQLQQGVEALLSEINQRMSTYISDSELSRFNRMASGKCQSVSKALLMVVDQAVAVNIDSGGSFNPLVEPLVRRWGFGAELSELNIPDASEIKQLLASADVQQLHIDAINQQLCKNADLQIDLSAIAKGYAVDELARWLASQGAINYLVDIGGEIKVAGSNPQGMRWRLAIEKPDAMMHSAYRVLELIDQSVATSGDYRNFFEHEGKRYSHTINPLTGYPTTHNLASVTVVHPSAMLADAWATAILAAGPEQGKQLALAQGLAVFMIQRENVTPVAESSGRNSNVGSNMKSNMKNNVTSNREPKAEVFTTWYSTPMQRYFAQRQPNES
jgi:thiamine biosynthesis lipoprotein